MRGGPESALPSHFLWLVLSNVSTVACFGEAAESMQGHGGVGHLERCVEDENAASVFSGR